MPTKNNSVDTIVFGGHGQACPKYPVYKVYNVSPVFQERVEG